MGAARNLDHWLSLLETRHPSVIELGLDRIASVLERMALPRLATHIITVAGTNGKGSTVACINALLVAQGMRTGVYTSPHLVRFNERIVIDGQPVDDDTLCAAFERIESVRGGISLTYFEFTTLAAFAVFADAALDAVVLEVGLGGRLDAVNAVDADIAVVTRIALDHQDWLGDSLEQIAFEKAGVMRVGKPAVIGQPSPPQSLREVAAAIGAPWYGRGEQFDLVATAQGWAWQSGATRVPLPPLQVPQDSAATALQVVALMGCLPAPARLQQVLAAVAVPGRFQETVMNGVSLVLDVAHNPDAATWLARRLQAEPCQGRTLAVFAALADKDIAGIVSPMAGCVDAWFVAELPGVARAMPASGLADAIAGTGSRMVSVSKNVRQALARARSVAGPDDRILVFGSFYTVGQVLALLQRC